MKYQVIGKDKDDDTYMGYIDDVFNTYEEASTFIGIEQTQSNSEYIELKIVRIYEEND